MGGGGGVFGVGTWLVGGGKGGGGTGFGAWFVGFWGVGDVECVLEVAGGMLLRDEEGVEVPEAGFDISFLTSVGIEEMACA